MPRNDLDTWTQLNWQILVWGITQKTVVWRIPGGEQRIVDVWRWMRERYLRFDRNNVLGRVGWFGWVEGSGRNSRIEETRVVENQFEFLCGRSDFGRRRTAGRRGEESSRVVV